jgi:hypothetical protein
LRSLLILTTATAIGCWWFLQPKVRVEQLAGKYLSLQRQVRLKKLPPNEKVAWDAPMEVINGELFRFVSVGTWRLRDENDDLLVAGRYENDQPHGKWTVYHVNGRRALEGEMVHGAKKGLWRTWDEEGQLLSEITYDPTKNGRKLTSLKSSQ